MKNLSIALLVLSIVIFSGCIVVVDDIVRVRGNGNLIESEIAVSSFEKINIYGSVKVSFYENDEYRAVVTVDSNLLEYTDIYTKGNTLNIGTKNGSFSFTKYEVDVYCPNLTDVSVSGSGSFFANDAISASRIELSISGSGKIEGTMICGNFKAKISGSGKIAVSGNANEADIDILGSGNFSGSNFTINNADVNIVGSGYADVYVTDYLDVEISGSGRINYWGNPTVNSKVIGSSRINKR